jgi:ATP-dependent Clp protease adaptor protein ClpS
MVEFMSDTVVAKPPSGTVKSKPASGTSKTKPRRRPPYHVILWDDDDHTYPYVIEMLRKLFGYSLQKAFMMAREVDTSGRVIVDTTTRERAELKRDQIHAYGDDWRLERCAGCMSCTIEPAAEGG